jgi:hypothetical protein
MAQSIEVFIRARPGVVIMAEEDQTSNNLQIHAETAKIRILRKKTKRYAEFQFSKVFPASSIQQEVYDALKVVRSVTEGTSGCVLAYGQTNTGNQEAQKCAVDASFTGSSVFIS